MGRGGEEKVALGSLESWEVAAAGFASLRPRVRERAREQERSERAPAMPIRPRLAAPGRGALPDSLRPGPARPRPPAPRAGSSPPPAPAAPAPRSARLRAALPPSSLPPSRPRSSMAEPGQRPRGRPPPL